MDARDMADLFLAAVDKIDFYWNFFVVMLIALIGWMISLKKGLPRRLKVLVSAGYLAFAVMNIQGLYGSYTFAEAVRTDMLAHPEFKPLAASWQVLNRHSYEWQRTMVFVIHGVVGVLVLGALWRGKPGSEGDEDENGPA